MIDDILMHQDGMKIPNSFMSLQLNIWMFNAQKPYSQIHGKHIMKSNIHKMTHNPKHKRCWPNIAQIILCMPIVVPSRAQFMWSMNMWRRRRLLNKQHNNVLNMNSNKRKMIAVAIMSITNHMNHNNPNKRISNISTHTNTAHKVLLKVQINLPYQLKLKPYPNQ